MAALPTDFSELEPFAGGWAIPTEKARYAKRLDSTIDELQAFYDAAFPKLDAGMSYLARFGDLDSMPEDAKRLLWLFCSLVTVSFPIEVWRQPKVPDSGSTALDAAVEPAV
jgi:hypothetical protein